MTGTLTEYVVSVLAAPGLVPGESLERRVAALVCDVVGVARLAADQSELNVLGHLDAADGLCSTVLTAKPEASPESAAFLNATAATWNELDEGLRGAGHPGVHVVCAATALAEHIGASGRALLNAAVRGYELQVALANSARLKKTVHAHGALGAPAAAFACAVLLHLEIERAVAAVNIAANLAPAGLFSACTDGSTVRHAFAGAGAQIGVRAAAMAAAGFTAPSESCEVAYGVVRGDSFSGWQPHDGTWTIAEGYLKSWSACAFTHTALDAAHALTSYEFELSQVSRVMVRLPRVGAQLDAVASAPPLAVRFSVPVLVALILGGHDVRDPAALDVVPSDVMALAERVEVVEDEGFNASWPLRSRASVEVMLTDGSVLREHRWDPATPVSDDDYVSAVVAKLDRLSVMTPRRAEHLMASVLSEQTIPPLFGSGDQPGPFTDSGITDEAAHITGAA